MFAQELGLAVDAQGRDGVVGSVRAGGGTVEDEVGAVVDEPGAVLARGVG
jgi:hypothetical protein